LLNSFINFNLSLFKGKDMSMLFASHAFLKIKLDLRNANSFIKDRVR